MIYRPSLHSLRRLVLSLGLVALVASLHGATSVSQFGITWTFSADHTVGQYANGDYWVVGPVTITSITPASTLVSGRTMNGTMINPPSRFAQTQGFDSAMYAQYGPSFDPALNAARPGGNDLSAGNPLVVAPGSSLVSSISAPIASITSGIRPQLTDAAILTVVDAPPPAGAFRPPPYGSNKTHSWNKSSLNYGLLRSLAPVASTPALATVEASLARPWLFFHTGPFSQYTSPSNGNPSGLSGFYGREMSWKVADAVLSLHLNYSNAQKETLYVRLVQLGIDLYGAVTFSQGTFEDLAGINNGRKLPILFAGLALGDSNLLTAVDPTINFKFSEDRQTFYVTQADVGRPLYHADGRPRDEYIQADVGLAEYGEQHIRSPNRDGRNWATMVYRDVVGTSYFGTALAAHLTSGAVSAWKWPAFFAYVDRYWTDPILTLPFHRNMWIAYRNLSDSSTPPPAVVAPTDAQIGIGVTP